MSANRSQRVTSQFLPAPSNSKMNSSTSPRWSRYFSRRCCLQMAAVCFCRFLVPNPILCAEFLYRILTAAHYARDFLLRNLSSAVSSPFFTFSTTVLNAKPSLGERDAEVVDPCGQLLLFRRVGFAQFGATRSITVVANVGPPSCCRASSLSQPT